MNRIIKGLFIGISYVLPGVCSSTTASVFGEYENILEFTSKFYSIKIIKKHLSLILGIGIGLITAIFMLKLLFNTAINVILAIFLGLNLGLIRYQKIPMKLIFWDIIGIILVLLLSFNFDISRKISLLSYIISGFIVSLGFVLPGLSGSLLMLSMGVYNEIFNKLNNISSVISLLDLNLISFFISLIIGIIIWSKILFKNIKNNFYLKHIIEGMTTAGILILSFETFRDIKDIYSSLILTFIVLLSFILTRKISQNIKEV